MKKSNRKTLTTLRVVMRNSSNERQWQLNSDMCLLPNPGRRLLAYVTIDR